MEGEKEAESTKSQKKLAKEISIRDNLCKKKSNKKAIDTLVGITSSRDIDSDNDGDEVIKSKIRINFQNQSLAFAEEPSASDISNFSANQQSIRHKCKYHRFILTHTWIKEKTISNKTDIMVEM